MSGWSRRRICFRRSWFGWMCGAAWLAVATLCCSGVRLSAQTVDEEGIDDENPYHAGVIARFVGADGNAHQRWQELISLSPHDATPDARLAPGPFRAEFSAHVLVQAPGEYRLSAFAAGRVRIKLAEQIVLDASSAKPAWLTGKSVELEFGFHPLTVEYVPSDEPVRLALFWEGPGFALEPLAARWLFHERAIAPDETFERGRLATRVLRCAACHEVPGETRPLAAPSVEHLAGNISRAWIVERLTGGGDESPSAAIASSHSMPHLAMSAADAAAVADYLLATSLESSPAVSDPPAKAPPKERGYEKKPSKTAAPSAAAGATLFHTIGCLACHRVGELGHDGPFGGGDLSSIASKRPAEFFARWLAHPETINRQHRMPVFALADDERQSLSLYLQSLGEAATDSSAAGIDQTARGAAIVQAARCSACHALPESPPAGKRLPLDQTALENESRSCLFAADAARHRPGYRLPETVRSDVVDYLHNVHPKAAESIDGRDLLVERNCLACHARGHGKGLASILPAVIEADTALAAALSLLRPPSLVGVGDKLRDEALIAAITRTNEPRQPWLRVRMPKFPLDEQETAALVRHLIDADRIPERDAGSDSSPQDSNDSAIASAGARLVNADGFGCTSCHAIGNWAPQKVAPGAEGAALTQIGNRVRRSWFDRWVRNPVRILPDMEMPAIVKPIRGVLAEDIDAQIASLWHVLNQENFTPPAPNALRVVRHSNLPGDESRAAVLTDVIEVGGAPFDKPLVIGMANRHNVLYDLANGRLAAWWTGDTARQQTRGKSWFWEAGVPQLWPADNRQSVENNCELVLLRGDERVGALPNGQYVTEFDTLEHVAAGVEFTHRLHFPGNSGAHTVFVRQRFAPLPPTSGGSDSGFARTLRFDALPAGMSGELLVLPGEVTIDDEGRTATLDQPTRLRVELVEPQSARLVKSPRGAVVTFASDSATFACELHFRADIAVDQFAPLPAVDRRVEAKTLDVVPGFDAVRLPLDDRCMPTGLAWRPDGTLVAASLEGRVWLARDTDGDGLEDSIAPFSDDLAAPYGVAAAGEAIDVINKYGLLRLFDADRDGYAERTQQIASGWGHTRDYHDWAVGLERDQAGNYYIALPCEQDERSEAAAHLRGRALRLAPREATPDDPRLYAIEEICGGLRFPQGLARSPAGELFVTDNQGNYNPFNELNHLQPGKRYGFINSLEAKRGLAPQLETSAIEIPHPWTRSVNGLCFLHVPGEGDAAAKEHFGPFADHLVGCEYDTRRLVRMSLEKVGGEYQGAVYPLSREPAAGEETFEGPVSCAVSPKGDLYVGNLRASGWGAGSNTGSIVRLRWQGQQPPGIAEVRSRHDGFVITFTQPVDHSLASDKTNYAISSYRRISTSAYGGPDVDRRIETIERVRVADDGASVTITLPELRSGFVYDFHLRNLTHGDAFFPAEAYYTLRRDQGSGTRTPRTLR